MGEKKKAGGFTSFDSASGLQQFGRKFVNPYGKAKDIEWQDPAEEKGMFRYIRVFCIAIAVICVSSAVSYYRELGGIEGIMSAEMMETHGKREFIACLGGMVLYPILSIVCLYFAFRRRK